MTGRREAASGGSFRSGRFCLQPFQLGAVEDTDCEALQPVAREGSTPAGCSGSGSKTTFWDLAGPYRADCRLFRRKVSCGATF
jgi:hypothetical protein